MFSKCHAGLQPTCIFDKSVPLTSPHRQKFKKVQQLKIRTAFLFVSVVDYLTKFKIINNMKQILFSIATAAMLLSIAPASFATPKEKTVMVGGAAMYPSKNIVENAVNSKDHTTLVAAVKAAGLVSTLQSDGPFTVFAPTNAAFNMLPKGPVEGLLKPEMKDQLTGVLTYHVVSGNYSAADLMKMIKAGGGMAKLTTVQGEELTVMMKGKGIAVKDSKGGVAMVTTKDVFQKNGVIHVVNKVLMP
jgi:uncharacterized surface protein with fasciclin (FAS1) repeats